MALKNQQAPYVSQGEMNFRNDFKRLALTIVSLIRSYIVAVATGYGDDAAVAERLYNIPVQYKDIFQLIFGVKPSEDILNLLSMYYVAIFTFINALKNKDQANVDFSVARMYKIADDIAAYFAKINPFWNEARWKNLLYAYAKLVIEESVAFLSGDFKKDLEINDRLVYHSLIVGDQLADGILQYLTSARNRENAAQCIRKA